MKPPSGRTIVLELLREMESRLYPLMYRTLPPAEYHVYLHPDDYAQVHPISAAIVTDAQRGLSAKVDEINRRSRWTRLLLEKRAPIEAPAAGWEIHLHPEVNGELSRGELGIESRLLLPAPRQFDGGAATTLIARTTVTGTLRKTTSEVQEAAPPPASIGEGAKASTVEAPTAGPIASAGRTSGTPGRTARLKYVDEAGTHDYAIRKDLISIGRGGSAHWVDVQVVSSPRVSREHCRIRRTADGRFFLQDVSTWGTSIDGHRVAPFVREQEGHLEEIGHEHPLTGPARIQLADTVVIDFALES